MINALKYGRNLQKDQFMMRSQEGKNLNKVSTSTSEVHIGNIVVNTQATDAKGIAADLRGSVNKVFSANAGIN